MEDPPVLKPHGPNPDSKDSDLEDVDEEEEEEEAESDTVFAVERCTFMLSATTFVCARCVLHGSQALLVLCSPIEDDVRCVNHENGAEISLIIRSSSWVIQGWMQCFIGGLFSLFGLRHVLGSSRLCFQGVEHG